MQTKITIKYIYQILLFLGVAFYILMPSISYGQTLPSNLNEIYDTSGQDNLSGTDGDDLFILSGAGNDWNWDNVIGQDGTDYIQMPISIDEYVDANPFSLGGYLFVSTFGTGLGTVWADSGIEYLVFPEGIYTVDEAVGVIEQ